MTFDFMKDFMMFEDEERFAGLCEQLEEVILWEIFRTSESR